MFINLEQIDELRKRANVGYSEAKEALERFDGNLVEALAYLEGQKKIKTNCFSGTSNGFVSSAKKLLDKGFKTRVIVKKDDKIKLNVSANTAIFFGIISVHATVLVGLAGLVTRHKLSIEKYNGEEINVNESFENAANAVVRKDDNTNLN